MARELMHRLVEERQQLGGRAIELLGHLIKGVMLATDCHQNRALKRGQTHLRHAPCKEETC